MADSIAFDTSPELTVVTPPTRRDCCADFALQVGHRAAIISFFAFLATLAILYMGGNANWAIAVAFASADVGVCSAILARSLGRARWPRRETIGLLLFSGALVVLSLQLMLLTRLDWIRAAANSFFTPG